MGIRLHQGILIGQGGRRSAVQPHQQLQGVGLHEGEGNRTFDIATSFVSDLHQTGVWGDEPTGEGREKR